MQQNWLNFLKSNIDIDILYINMKHKLCCLFFRISEQMLQFGISFDMLLFESENRSEWAPIFESQFTAEPTNSEPKFFTRDEQIRCTAVTRVESFYLLIEQTVFMFPSSIYVCVCVFVRVCMFLMGVARERTLESMMTYAKLNITVWVCGVCKDAGRAEFDSSFELKPSSIAIETMRRKRSINTINGNPITRSCNGFRSVHIPYDQNYCTLERAFDR